MPDPKDARRILELEAKVAHLIKRVTEEKEASRLREQAVARAALEAAAADHDRDAAATNVHSWGEIMRHAAKRLRALAADPAALARIVASVKEQP
jgi:hypothetical protein